MAKPDEEVKLILDAFQMSVSGCVAAPGSAVLRAQMHGRLMAVNPTAFQVGGPSIGAGSQGPQPLPCSRHQQCAQGAGLTCMSDRWEILA